MSARCCASAVASTCDGSQNAELLAHGGESLLVFRCVGEIVALRGSATRRVAAVSQQESFWSTLKTEFYHRHTFTSRADAIQAVTDWIENTYKIAAGAAQPSARSAR